MEGVHAGQEPHLLSGFKLDHTNGAFASLHIGAELIRWNLFQKPPNSLPLRIFTKFTLVSSSTLTSYICDVQLIYIGAAMW